MSAFSLLHNRCLLCALLVAASGCGMVAQNRNAQGIRYYNKGQIAIAQTHIFGPNLLNEVRLGYAS